MTYYNKLKPLLLGYAIRMKDEIEAKYVSK